MTWLSLLSGTMISTASKRNVRVVDSSLNRYIVFEGARLPHYAAFLDVAASNKVIPIVDDSVSAWFWHFAICIGTDNKAPSRDVLENAQRLHNLLRTLKNEILPKINDSFPEQSEQEIYSDWLRGLEIMIETARATEECTWTGIVDDDSNSGKR